MQVEVYRQAAGQAASRPVLDIDSCPMLSLQADNTSALAYYKLNSTRSSAQRRKRLPSKNGSDCVSLGTHSVQSQGLSPRRMKTAQTNNDILSMR